VVGASWFPTILVAVSLITVAGSLITIAVSILGTTGVGSTDCKRAVAGGFPLMKAAKSGYLLSIYTNKIDLK
jgi:hypothetical protein